MSWEGGRLFCFLVFYFQDLLYVCRCYECMHVYVPGGQCPQRPEEDTEFPENWSYMWLATTWVRGIKPRSSERAVNVLYYWAISPVSVY